MKKFLTIMALCFTLGASAAVEKDTVAIRATEIERIVEDKGISSKGKEYVRYYALINKELVPVSKNVISKLDLCKKYGATCALAAVRNKHTKKLIRIILN